MNPIAIIGTGCRLPGGVTDLASYQTLLRQGIDAISEIPSDRWSVAAYASDRQGIPGKTYSRWGGFVAGIDQFEPDAFGISAREAAFLDPQQRMLLEVTWEALAEAGIPLATISGSRTGVFVGISTLDYSQLQAAPTDKRSLQSFTALGTSMSIAANRLSYCLNARGPSFVIDTACSSSMVALDRAVKSLQSGECDLAIVGGVNALLAPDVFISFCAASMLSPDGRCKAFDASANGFVRAEGAGAIVLRRLDAALDRTDRILALILGSGVNQDGRTTGLAMPNGDAQAQLMREVYARLEIDPASLAYVEAHGTGTAIGDPTEAFALGEVFSAGRDLARPLVIGSVKTNIGHLESASGMASVLKAVLSIRQRVVFRNLHFRQPNPRIPFGELKLRVPVETEPWPDPDRPAVIGINSFGFGGTNAHVVLAENTTEICARYRTRVSVPVALPDSTSLVTDKLLALPITARNELALRELVSQFRSQLLQATDDDLPRICRTAALRRTHDRFRLCVSGSSRQELAEKLLASQNGERPQGVAVGSVNSSPSNLVFVYSGQGPQHPRMGADLFRDEPVYRDWVQQCDARIAEHLGWSILAEMERPAETSRIDETCFAQPALFTQQVSLTALWRSWGVTPNTVLGHSVGEVAAAWAAGALNLDEACRVIAWRSRSMQQAHTGGKMLAAALDRDDADRRIKRYAGQVSLAAVNSPRQVTLSGEARLIDELAQQLERDGVWHRFLRVSHAFHSAAMTPAESLLRQGLADLRSSAPAIALVSTVTGRPVSVGELNADYWWRNVREGVLFAPAAMSAPPNTELVFLEIGPHPVLSGALQECAREAGRTIEVLASQRRDVAGGLMFRTTLGQLFVRGTRCDFECVVPGDNTPIDLPKHPWHRERFWHDHAEMATARNPSAFHPLLGFRRTSGVSTWEQTLDPRTFAWLSDHVVKGTVVVPGAAYLEMMLAALAEHRIENAEQPCFCLDNVQFLRALFIAGDSAPKVQVTLSDEGHTLNIHSRTGSEERLTWTRNATADWSAIEATAPETDSFETLRARCSEQVSIPDSYAELADRGLEYGPQFQTVRSLWKSGQEALGEIRRLEVNDSENWWCHPVVLDACFQVFSVLIPIEHRESLHLPVRIGHLRVWSRLGDSVWCYARLSQSSEYAVEGDLWLFDAAGKLIAEIAAFRCQRASSSATRDRAQRRPQAYVTCWHQMPIAALTHDASSVASHPRTDSQTTKWLVLADTKGVCQPIVDQIQAAGETSVCPLQTLDQLTDLLGQFPDGPLNVLHSWSLDVSAPESATSNFERDTQLSLDSVVAVMQAITNTNRLRPGRLVLLTQQARRLPADTGEYVGHACGTLGLGRVIANEFPQWSTKLIDLPHSSSSINWEDVTAEILGSDAEQESVWRDANRWVPRLEPAPALDVEQLVPADVAAYRLDAGRGGSVDALAWVPAHRPPPGPGEVEVAVHCTAINFRDVLKCLGLYPADRLEELALGDECAGEVIAIGSGVTGYRVGDRVVGCLSGCFRSHAVIRADLLLPILPDWTMSDAATIPIAFLTAWYSLRTLGQLEAGETVLIHAAAGGVGQAAVQIARSIGARVFATAGTEEKRQLLRQQGCELVLDSRTLTFADEIRRHTNGRGVDVVLNSLAGEALHQSVGCLAPYGRFLEIGKRDLFGNSKLGLWPLRQSASFHAIDLGAILQDKPALAKRLLGELRNALESGQLRPLSHHNWPASQVAQAFRVMSQGKHTGKLVVDVRDPELRVASQDVPRVRFRPDGTYLVTGGLGGFGFETAKWIAARGGGHLVLISRRSTETPEVQNALDQVRQLGASARAHSVDVSDHSQVARLFEMLRHEAPPVRGIFHAAMVIDDAPLMSLDPARFRTSLRPKALGAWNLHEETRDLPLEHFVLFSSISASIGNRGQANYAAANALLEGLAAYRRSQGRPAIAIGWGFVTEVGFAAGRDELMKHAARSGFLGATPAQYFQVLERLLVQDHETVVVGDFDWQAVAEGFWRDRVPQGLFTSLVGEFAGRGNRSVDTSRLRDELEIASPDDRTRLLREYLQSQIGRILGIAPAKVDAARPVTELGLDSLMGIELVTVIERDLSASLPTLAVSRDLTVNRLVHDLLKQLGYAESDSTVRVSTDDEATAAENLFLELRSEGTDPPLICFHPIGGDASCYAELVDSLPAGFPVLGVQSRLLSGHEEYPTVEAMIAAYALAIRTRIPTGPYRLCGFSLGGYLAAGVAEQLESEGLPVDFVGVIDCPDYSRTADADGAREQLADLILSGYQEFALSMPFLHPVDESDRPAFSELAESLCQQSDDPVALLLDWLHSHKYIQGERPGLTAKTHLKRLSQHLLLVSTCTRIPTVRAPLTVWQAARGIGTSGQTWQRGDDLPVSEIVLNTDHSGILHQPTVAGIARHIAVMINAHSESLSP